MTRKTDYVIFTNRNRAILMGFIKILVLSKKFLFLPKNNKKNTCE